MKNHLRKEIYPQRVKIYKPREEEEREIYIRFRGGSGNSGLIK